ncbi:MAG: TnpV protein [Firmicutes bacterium]|nr:TnpV protein [Bacillota bacterium]
MKKDLKTRITDGITEVYSEQAQAWLPETKEEAGMTYLLDTETMTYIPQIAPEPQEEYEMGMWGKRRLNYLKENRPVMYEELVMDGLWAHLVSVDRKAEEMSETLLEQMSEAEGVNAELKKKDHMEWAARRSGIKNRVHEIIYNELIYA